MQIPAPTNSQKQSMKCTGQNRHPDPRQRPCTETWPPYTTTTKSTQSPRPPRHEEAAERWIEIKIHQYHITHGKSPQAPQCAKTKTHQHYIIHGKSLPSPTARRKNFSMPFPSNPAPKQILNFLFMILFVKLMASNFRRWFKPLNLCIFPEILCAPLALTPSFASDWKKKIKVTLNLFFKSRMK